MARRLVSSRRVFEGRKVSLRVDTYEGPYGRYDVEVVEFRGAVVVLPLIGDRVVLVKQYRYPVSGYLLELPAGTLEPGESPEECAARELEEETGYRPGRLAKLGEFYASPGYSTELLHAFLAKDLEKGEPRREAYEEIEVVEVPLAQLLDMAARGEVRDSKTLATLALYLLKRSQTLPDSSPIRRWGY